MPPCWQHHQLQLIYLRPGMELLRIWRNHGVCSQQSNKFRHTVPWIVPYHKLFVEPFALYRSLFNDVVATQTFAWRRWFVGFNRCSDKFPSRVHVFTGTTHIWSHQRKPWTTISICCANTCCSNRTPGWTSQQSVIPYNGIPSSHRRLGVRERWILTTQLVCTIFRSTRMAILLWEFGPRFLRLQVEIVRKPVLRHTAKVCVRQSNRMHLLLWMLQALPGTKIANWKLQCHCIHLWHHFCGIRICLSTFVRDRPSWVQSLWDHIFRTYHRNELWCCVLYRALAATSSCSPTVIKSQTICLNTLSQSSSIAFMAAGVLSISFRFTVRTTMALNTSMYAGIRGLRLFT